MKLQRNSHDKILKVNYGIIFPKRLDVKSGLNLRKNLFSVLHKIQIHSMKYVECLTNFLSHKMVLFYLGSNSEYICNLYGFVVVNLDQLIWPFKFRNSVNLSNQNYIYLLLFVLKFEVYRCEIQMVIMPTEILVLGRKRQLVFSKVKVQMFIQRNM